MADLSLEAFNHFISNMNEGFEDIEETDDEEDSEEECICDKEPCECNEYSIGSFIVEDGDLDLDGDFVMF